MLEKPPHCVESPGVLTALTVMPLKQSSQAGPLTTNQSRELARGKRNDFSRGPMTGR